jgi:hypothetical protein
MLKAESLSRLSVAKKVALATGHDAQWPSDYFLNDCYLLSKLLRHLSLPDLLKESGPEGLFWNRTKRYHGCLEADSDRDGER